MQVTGTLPAEVMLWELEPWDPLRALSLRESTREWRPDVSYELNLQVAQNGDLASSADNSGLATLVARSLDQSSRLKTCLLCRLDGPALAATAAVESFRHDPWLPAMLSSMEGNERPLPRMSFSLCSYGAELQLRDLQPLQTWL